MQFNINYGILGKDNQSTIYDYYFKSLLSKLNSLFIWGGLPETVDKDFLNSNLFLLGYSAFFEKNGNIYTNFGGLGGKPNENYFNTKYILANPVLGSGEYEIEKDCTIIYNTDADRQLLNLAHSGGLYSLIHQTATLLTDNIQSINSAQINSRVQSVFKADNDNQRRSAEEYLKRQYGGEPFSIITSDDLQKFEVLNISVDTDKTITNLIELHQYIIADFYNNIGITTTPYQKRERLITDEIGSLEKMTECTLESMLKARQEGADKVNNMFGTDISVRLADFLTQSEEQTTDPNALEVEDGEELTDKDGQERTETGTSEQAQPDPDPDPDREEAQRIADEGWGSDGRSQTFRCRPASPDWAYRGCPAGRRTGSWWTYPWKSQP